MKNRKLGIPLTALLLTDCGVVNPAPTDGAETLPDAPAFAERRFHDHAPGSGPGRDDGVASGRNGL